LSNRSSTCVHKPARRIDAEVSTNNTERAPSELASASGSFMNGRENTKASNSKARQRSASKARCSSLLRRLIRTRRAGLRKRRLENSTESLGGRRCKCR